MNSKSLKTLEFSKITSLLAEYAGTESGKKLCRELIPSTDIDEIRLAQRETSDACDRVRLKGSISFGGAQDIRGAVKRLEVGSSLSIHELLSISSLLTCAARAKAYGRGNDDTDREDSLTEYFNSLEPLTNLNNEIKRCIISEEEVSDDASPGLRSVRRQLRSAGERVHSQLNAVMNSARTYLQDAVITMRNGRYCLPVKAEYKNHVSGMVHDQSSSGSTFFIEPMSVVKLNNEIRELEIKEQKEIEAVLASLSEQAAAYPEALTDNYRLLTHLDFVFAKSALSRHFKCSEPIFNDKGYINIKSGRHPLLNPDQVVPIDIYLGDAFDLLIITGPNTGGKTVSLKTVGLFTLMGQAGLHIPAFEGSQLAVFTEVFADIGDEQSIEQSLSTFSSHMTNIVSILNAADDKSLVLFDELCSGTDPTEGAALAMSILTFLHNMKVRTVATTHYSELKIFALSTEGVENACCEFNVETLRPTYRLLIGIPGKSNAFAISKKLGLMDFIIEDAGKYIGKQDQAFEDVIAELESTRVTLESEQEEVRRYKEEISQLKARLSKQHEKLDASREKMMNNANEEARRIVQEAKDFADKTIREINKLAASSPAISRELEAKRSELRDRLSKLDESAKKERTAKPKKQHKAEDFKIGDGVRVLSMNLNGTISTLPNAKGDCYVQMGILRSLVNIKDLELLQEDTINGPGGTLGGGKASKGMRQSHGSQIKVSKTMTISPEINLIGMTTDEAIPVLDKYLDDAYLARLPQVRVVHGRGTGALKAAVHKHLKRLKYVSSYRLGTFGEGDSGVTIVEFDTKQS